MKNILIQSVKATEMVLPDSELVHDTASVFAKKLLTGSSWTEFPVQPKWIIEIELQNGLIGIGETYRSALKELKVAARIRCTIPSDTFGKFVRKDDLITQHKTA